MKKIVKREYGDTDLEVHEIQMPENSEILKVQFDPPGKAIVLLTKHRSIDEGESPVTRRFKFSQSNEDIDPLWEYIGSLNLRAGPDSYIQIHLHEVKE